MHHAGSHKIQIPTSRWFCNPLIKNPMVELQHEWFAFTIVESHIGWALMKNKEYAVDRMNWLRLFS